MNKYGNTRAQINYVYISRICSSSSSENTPMNLNKIPKIAAFILKLALIIIQIGDWNISYIYTDKNYPKFMRKLNSANPKMFGINCNKLN